MYKYKYEVTDFGIVCHNINNVFLFLQRFWVSVRFQHLYFIRKFGKMVAEELVINSRLAAWAFLSDCQDDLLSSVLSTEPSWLEMRNLGIGLWYANVSQLRTRVYYLIPNCHVRLIAWSYIIYLA